MTFWAYTLYQCIICIIPSPKSLFYHKSKNKIINTLNPSSIFIPGNLFMFTPCVESPIPMYLKRQQKKLQLSYIGQMWLRRRQLLKPGKRVHWIGDWNPGQGNGIIEIESQANVILDLKRVDVFSTVFSEISFKTYPSRPLLMIFTSK